MAVNYASYYLYLVYVSMHRVNCFTFVLRNQLQQ